MYNFALHYFENVAPEMVVSGTRLMMKWVMADRYLSTI